jgi:hypothetical protein
MISTNETPRPFQTGCAHIRDGTHTLYPARTQDDCGDLKKGKTLTRSDEMSARVTRCQ